MNGLGRGGGLLLWGLVLAPLAALLPASILDQSPGGTVRPTPFPIALAALDPYVWDCVENSLLMALAVTSASGLIGLALARAVFKTPISGLRPLVALGVGAMATPPAFGAIGLKWLVERTGLPHTPWLDWGIWFWVALTVSVPIVALATSQGLAKVDPSWTDAARLAGASRARAFRKLVWPTIRPAFAKSLGVVFTLTVIEPGAPMVLGLRKTLGFQIVKSALARDQIGRAAVLALGATLLAAVVRIILHRWGGSETTGLEPPLETRRGSSSGLQKFGLIVVLCFAITAAWLPIAGLVMAALRIGSGWIPLHAIAGLARDPMLVRYVINSSLVGLIVLTLELILARSLAASRVRWLEGWPEAFPMLAIGVGALALPYVLGMGIDSLPSRFGGRPRMLADLLDLDRTPYVLLVLALTTACAPLPARSAIGRFRAIHPIFLDAAATLGSSPRQARRTLIGRWLGVGPGAALLTFILAASNLTPALILCPTADVRTIGPAVLVLVKEPVGLNQGAILALVAVMLNIVAMALGSMRLR